MVQYEQRLDRMFGALAEPARRAILERLERGDASISELAEPLGMTLTGVKKHVQLLEEVGLVRTAKVGRTRCCSLGDGGLELATSWIDRHRRALSERLDRFAQLVHEHQSTQERGRS